MKDTVSLPRPLREKAAKVARKLRISRSRLYSRAVEAFVAQYEEDAVTEAINRACATVDTSLPPDIAENARRMLKKVEW